MNRICCAAGLLISLLFLGGLALAQKSSAFKERPALAGDPLADFLIGEPIVHGNLAVFPVSSKKAKHADRFITLDEGLSSGDVEIYEQGALREGVTQREAAANDDGDDPLDNPFAPAVPNTRGRAAARAGRNRVANDVNRLLLINKADKPLYLMPGEIIIGGSQDRTIARELVIPPSEKPVAIDVFCVEHGRWGARDREEYGAYLAESQSNTTRASSVTIQAPARATTENVARQANSGKFIGSVGSLNKQSRLAVQSGKGQQKVWEEVGKVNDKAGVKSSSGAFTGNYAERHVVTRLEPYLKKLQRPVTQAENVVGVIVAVNGKVESMDVFESTPLFRKLWPKLLKSYSLDASNVARSKGRARAATRFDAAAFMRDVVTATAKQSETHGSLAISRRENERVLLFSAHEAREGRQAAPAAGGLGGGYGAFGGAIHSAAYGK